MNETLTLNDGTVLQDSHVIMSGDILFVYIKEKTTLAEVFNLLIDPEKTRKIAANRYGEENVYAGYTKLLCVKDEERNLITAMLRHA